MIDLGIDRLLMRLSAKLGGCGRCMRTAWRVAAAAWLLALPASLVVSWQWAAAVPALLTMLWLAHIGAFALKNFRAKARSADRAAPLDGRTGLARRDVLVFALRAAAAAVVMSLSWPRLANAQGECDGGWHICNDGRHCCPDGMNFLCLYDDCKNAPNRCYRAVSDEDYKYLQSCCQGLLNC